jgi:DNA ligase-1
MRTLVHFKNFVNEISANNSRKYKQSVLQKYKDDMIIEKYLNIAFNPYTVYGISTKKLTKCVEDDDHYLPATVFDLFKYLETNNTGRDKDIAVCYDMLDEVASWDMEASDLLRKLICKELVIGCDAKTINAVIPDCIQTFNVQLANKYFDKPEIVEGKEFVITTKIDGGRIIALKENGQVSFYTRAGQKYEGLVDLERELLEKFPDNVCLDGEITLLNNAGIPSKEAYKQTMKITRKDGEKHGIKMLVFDWMPATDFKRQKCDIPYSRRSAEVETLFANIDSTTYFEVLPFLYHGTDTAKIMELLDKAIAEKEEGVMINLWDAPYEFKRTNSLLKVKKMSTVDLEIVGYEEGSGRLAGTLGAVLVRYKKGNVVKVGSGFSDEIRKEIWANQSKYFGTVCEIQYFEETTNADGGISLRFPIFKDFRPDKPEADF